jgi:NitT/TauT family transport system substrate-binding protein
MTLLLGAAGLLRGCGIGSHLRLGIHPWIGYESLYLAEHFGWLDDSVELIKNANASQSLSGLKEETLDAAALTLDEVLSAREQGLPLKVVLVFNHSVGADAVLVKEGIKQLSQLRGKRIAVEQTAVGALMLTKLLKASGLNRSEINILDIPPDSQVGAWEQGQIDAAITYEPTASRLAQQGAVRIFDSRAIPNTIFDVLAVMPGRPSSPVKAAVRGYLKGLEHIRLSRQDALHRIAAWRGLAVQDVSHSLSGIHLPDLQANHAYLAGNGDLQAAARELGRLMLQAGLLTRSPALEGLVDNRYLPINGNGY